MHHSASLNDLYAEFTAGSLEKSELEEAVFKMLGRKNHHFTHITREDYEDYISWLYPRISNAITAYRETGSSFQTYIVRTVHLTEKEYRLRLMRKNISETTAWGTQIHEMCANEHEPHYDMIAEAFPGKTEKVRNPRQMLILTLKCCNYISEDLLEKIAFKLKIEADVLRTMIERLKELRLKRERRIALLRDSAACQFFRCVMNEKTLRILPENSIKAQKIKMRLERGRIRLRKMRARLARLRPDPSNAQVAEILGISKGTVDASLYALKSKAKANRTIHQKNVE